MLEMSSLKPSIVLQAMVTGLLNSGDDSLFEINMGTYGKVQHEICYGCCATLALTEMFGKGQSPSELMLGHVKSETYRREYVDYAYAPLSNFIKLESSSVQGSLPIDLRKLEMAVDSARRGNVSRLIEFLTGETDESFDSLWELDDCNWEEQLPKIEETIAEMTAAGY